MLERLHVCICTHNPRWDVFEKVLRSISEQTCTPDKFELIIIDNASTPPIDGSRCRALLGPQISLKLEREPILGNAHARVKAAAVATGSWLLFVDDDNELDSTYIQLGMDIINQNPDLGCFGGRLILPDYLKPPKWLEPILPFLAIKDGGDVPVTRMVREWGVWYPPTAGAFVRRALLDSYIEVMKNNPLASMLGRKGRKNLNSGEDSLIMLSAYDLGYSASYQPALKLNHHLHDGRFKMGYLLRLMYGYGKSHIILARVRGEMPLKWSERNDWVNIIKNFYREFRSDSTKTIRYAACMLAFRIGYIVEERNIIK